MSNQTDWPKSKETYIFINFPASLFLYYIKMTTPRARRRPIRKLPPDYPSHLLRQPALDLFGEVAITTDDIFAWVAAVSPIHCSDRSYDLYVKRWDVAGKVRHAKLAGTFEARIARPARPWHARLALSQIL